MKASAKAQHEVDKAEFAQKKAAEAANARVDAAKKKNMRYCEPVRIRSGTSL